VAFVLHVRLDREVVPPLDELQEELSERLDLDVLVDEDSARDRAPRTSEVSPWPQSRTGFYVARASTRGADVAWRPDGGRLEAIVTLPVLGTWTDWELGVELAGALGSRGDDGVRVPGEGQHLAAGLRQEFLATEERYLTECVAGAERMRQSIEQDGKLVRVGGPAGFAVIGPRTWEAVRLGPDEDLPLRLVDTIQRSIDAEGYEDFHPANPLWLDGRSGRELVAALLPPDRSTLLRDPEYVLLSPDLEADGAELVLLPFERLEDAFPGLVRWLDDRCAAIPAIPWASWPSYLERAGAWLTTAADLLDGGLAEPPAPLPPPRPWWKIW
jgi:hypothetical protein